MYIFLDDLRRSSGVEWVVVRTGEECIDLIDKFFNEIDMISFDHDLGEGITGYDVAKYIEAQCFAGPMICPRWVVHSANPVGRGNIIAAMKAAERASAGDR